MALNVTITHSGVEKKYLKGLVTALTSIQKRTGTKIDLDIKDSNEDINNMHEIEAAHKKEGRINSDTILRTMDAGTTKKNELWIHFTDKLLLGPNGEKTVGGATRGQASIISAKAFDYPERKLAQAGADSAVIAQARINIILHEVHHALDLKHCSNKECNMHPHEITKGKIDLCPKCSKKLKMNVKERVMP